MLIGGLRSIHGAACSSWASQTQQRRLIAKSSNEMDTNRQTIARLMQRQGNRRLAGEIDHTHEMNPAIKEFVDSAS